MSQEEKEALIEEEKRKNANAAVGSIAAKANMVKDFNENKK